MADFDIIETYNPAEETINFGTRVIASGHDLHEAVTLCILKSSMEKYFNFPEMEHLVHEGKFYLSVEKSFRIFNNVNCKSLDFNGKFEAVIDVFCSGGNYILICIRDGTFHLYDKRNSKIVLASSVVNDGVCSDKYFINCFHLPNEKTNVSQFLIVTREGIVYRASLNYESEDTVEFNIEILFDFHTRIKVASFTANMLLLNGDKCIICDINDPAFDLNYNGLNLKSIYPYDDEQFIGLTNEGALVYVCAVTLQIHPISTTVLYENMVFYNGNNKMAFVSCKIDKKNYVKLLKFSDFNEVYSIEVNNNICLVYSASEYDEQLYITKANTQEIRVQMITETVPEKRLERLLKKKQFDEAELFANTFNLDIEDVKKARVMVFIDMTLGTSEEISQLINMLESISDVAFKLKVCLDVSCDTLDGIKTVLRYGLGLNLSKHDNAGDQVEMYYSRINELMHKFDTFLMLLRLNKGRFDPDIWQEFSSADLFKYLLQELKHKNIETAITLFARLDASKILTLATTDVSDVLDVLEKMPIDIYTTFLHAFIPKTIHYIPTSLPQFVRWICDRVLHIERNEFHDFPNNAIEFMNKMVRLLNINPFANINFEEFHINFKNDLEWMSSMLQCLETVQVFKDNFKLFVPLQDCLKGPVSLVQALLCMEVIDVNDKLMNFLVQFLVKSNFEPDIIFINVIEELIVYDEKYWINVISPIWKKINSVEQKLNSLKLIMKSANLPWCNIIRDMYKHALSLNHTLVSEIEMDIKMEPIYIVLSKYNLKLESVELLRDMFAVNRVIFLNGIEDAYTLCLNDEMRCEVTLTLLQKFIWKEDISSAVKILVNLKESDVINVTPRFLQRTEMYLEEEGWMNITQKENAVHIAELLLNRNSDSRDGFLQKFYEEYLRKLQTILLLEKNYGLHFKLADLIQNKDFIINDVILLNTIQEYKSKEIGVPEAIAQCNKFKKMLFIKGDELLLKLCMNINDVNFLCSVASFIYENCTDVASLVKIVVIIMDRFKSKKIDFLSNSESRINESEDDIGENFVDNMCLLKQTILYCQNISAKALLLEPTEEVHVAFLWSHTFSFLDDCGKKLQKSNHQDNITMLTPSSVEAICNIFTMYMKHITYLNGNMMYAPFVEGIEDMSEESILQEIDQMMHINLESLSGDGNHITACHLLICYMNNLTLIGINNAKITRVHMNFFYQRIKLLLEFVFSSTSIDKELAFNLLLLYPYEKAIKIIKQALGIYIRILEKFQVIAELGIKICNYYNMHTEKEPFKHIIMLGNWWKSLGTCNIPLKEFFSIPRNKLLEKLIENNISLENVTKFCNNFEIDTEFYYNYYLKNTLLKWKPDYTVEENMKGVRDLIIHNNEKQLFAKCEEVINVIKAKDKIYESVNNLWGLVNVYHYEVFICIIDILAMCKQADEVRKKKLLLIFLKKYIRSNKPSHSEIEEWYTKFPDTQNIDALSEWRLPFTSTLNGKDIWNILRPEVKLTNFDSWFEVVPILSNLYIDDICSYAVKDMVNSGQLNKSVDSEKWCLHSQFNYLFAKADSCIQHISNLERATSVAYYLMTHSPKGADQVIAAKLSYKYAKAFKNSPQFQDTPEDQRAFLKLRKKFYSYSSLHILYTNNLTEEKYINLASLPDELIEALYSDERVIKSSNSIILNCPDINKAVDEIAELYKINVQNTRLSLLEHWLNDGCNTSDTNMDESIFLSPVVNVTNDSEVYLKKASYICRSGDVTFWRDYLFSKGFQDNPKFSNYYYQARALKCFCSITPVDIVEKMAETSYKDLLRFINKLLLLHDLKCLGMNVNHESFTEYNSRSLLKKMSKNAERPLILKLMASICTYYEIFDMKYWELIINNMIKLKWFKHLKVHINFLKDNCMIYKEFYINGWQNIIDYSFNSLPNMDDDSFDSLCIENMHLIQSCPVLYQIDLKSVLLKCLQVKRSDLAALLLQYFPKVPRKELLRSILQNQDLNMLTNTIKALLTSGLVGTNYVIEYINEETKCDILNNGDGLDKN